LRGHDTSSDTEHVSIGAKKPQQRRHRSADY
jgi:hypothetical protein